MNKATSSESNGVSEGDNITPTWSWRAVHQRALAEISEDYRAASGNYDIGRAGPFGHANGIIPQKSSELMLIVGSYADEVQEISDVTVHAFVYGEKVNQIGFMCLYEQGEAFRLDACRVKEITFQPPFCYLVEEGLGQQSINRLLRPFLLFQFLHKGIISTFTSYNTFWDDFTKACAWIANKGRPSPSGVVTKRRIETRSERSASATAVDPKSALHMFLATESQGAVPSTRKFEEDEDAVQPRIKRRDYSDGTSTFRTQKPTPIVESPHPSEPTEAHSVEKRLRPDESQHQQEIARLTKQLEETKQRSDLVYNAYIGITQAQDERMKNRDKLRMDLEKLNALYAESLESGRGWKAQAEEAEKREETLEVQLNQLRDRTATIAHQLLEASGTGEET